MFEMTAKNSVNERWVKGTFADVEGTFDDDNKSFVRESDTFAALESSSHPLRRLIGTSHAVIEPFVVDVMSAEHRKVIGRRLVLHGGCEICVNNHALSELCGKLNSYGNEDDGLIRIPMVVDDPNLGGVVIGVLLRDLIGRCNMLREPHTGPRHSIGRARCAHDRQTPGCPSCIGRLIRRSA